MRIAAAVLMTCAPIVPSAIETNWARQILGYPSPDDYLFFAIENGSTDDILAALAEGASPDAIDPAGTSALSVAGRCRRPAAARLLIRAGAHASARIVTSEPPPTAPSPPPRSAPGFPASPCS